MDGRYFDIVVARVLRISALEAPNLPQEDYNFALTVVGVEGQVAAKRARAARGG